MISIAPFSDCGQYNSSDIGIVSVWTYVLPEEYSTLCCRHHLIRSTDKYKKLQKVHWFLSCSSAKQGISLSTYISMMMFQYLNIIKWKLWLWQCSMSSHMYSD